MCRTASGAALGVVSHARRSACVTDSLHAARAITSAPPPRVSPRQRLVAAIAMLASSSRRPTCEIVVRGARERRAPRSRGERSRTQQSQSCSYSRQAAYRATRRRLLVAARAWAHLKRALPHTIRRNRPHAGRAWWSVGYGAGPASGANDGAWRAVRGGGGGGSQQRSRVAATAALLRPSSSWAAYPATPRRNQKFASSSSASARCARSSSRRGAVTRAPRARSSRWAAARRRPSRRSTAATACARARTRSRCATRLRKGLRRRRRLGAPPQQTQRGAHDTKLFVGTLPRGADEAMLRPVFAAFGEITEIFFPPSNSRTGQQCAFVTYADASSLGRPSPRCTASTASRGARTRSSSAGRTSEATPTPQQGRVRARRRRAGMPGAEWGCRALGWGCREPASSPTRRCSR